MSNDNEGKYRDCIICGKHIAEIIPDKDGHSKIRYFSNADVLMIARSSKNYCKDCANSEPKLHE